MSSIIEGFNYDIFISYRQKDNKGDRWVSRFVEALKTELEATFKEDVLVYFDENPHDRLQETYDVDKSLEGKLKCLIFIPILSQTYCDPNSYAWQHEFLAFLQMVKNDRFGKDVKLRSGNVASRILPIRIHDLEPEDIKLFEKETGSVLRAMDFVFKTGTGAIRPLLPNEDHPNDNLYKTFYRDQISKVAIAIKEIILGIKAEPARVVKEKEQPKESVQEVSEEEKKIDLKQLGKGSIVKFLIPIAVVALLIVAGIIAYPRIFKKDTLERMRSSGERISVAVMPFINMTNDTTWNWGQSGLQNELITSLAISRELNVRPTESVNNLMQNKGFTNYASVTPSVAQNISQKLDASVFIYGTIKREGKTLRINAQLIDSKTKEIFKSFQIDGTEEKILHIVDSLSVMVRNFLVISILEKEIIRDFRPLISTNSPEAYKYYMFGNQAFYKADFPTATEWYKKAVVIDTNFTEAVRMLYYSLGHQGLIDESRKWKLRNYEKRDQMSDMERFWAEIGHAETPDEQVKYYKQLIALDEELPVPHSNLGHLYRSLNLYDKAIIEYEKELEIYEKWGSKPRWSAVYSSLSYAYHKTGQYKKEKKLFEKWERDFPDDQRLTYQQAVLALSRGDQRAGNSFIEKYKSFGEKESWTKTQILSNLGSLYRDAGMLDRAEECYRKSLSLLPGNPSNMIDLASFLIYADRDINKGLELADSLVKLYPDNFAYLHLKGWGFYKQGKYQEALETLSKSWDLRMQNADYDTEAFLHLEAAKKAVAGMKN